MSGGIRIVTTVDEHGQREAQRAAFLGLPGAGKTTTVQTLAAPVESCVVIDTKHVDREWRPFADALGYVVTGNPADVRRYPRVILRVDSPWIMDRAGWRKPGSVGYQWTEALESILWRRDTLTVVDEAMDVARSSSVHPSFRRISTGGRGLGCGLWLCTQAPLHVDTVAMQQVDHRFSTGMPSEEYRDVIRKRWGLNCDALAALPAKGTPGDPSSFQIAYHREGDSEWQIFDQPEPMKFAATRRPVEAVAAPDADPQSGFDGTPGDVGRSG